MEPVTLAMIASPMLAQSISGIFQKRQGKKMLKNLKLPEYEIPGAIQENVSDAKRLAQMGMPAAQYTQAKQNIERSQSAALNALQGRGQALAGVGNIMQRASDATLNLDTQSANMRLMGMRMKQAANSQLAQQQLAKQQWEKFNPYLAKVQEAQALMGAGQQNFMGGLTNLSSIAAMGMGDGGFLSGLTKQQGANG